MITPVLDCILDIEEPEDIKDFVIRIILSVLWNTASNFSNNNSSYFLFLHWEEFF